MTARKAASQIDMNGHPVINLPSSPTNANDAAPKAWASSRANHTGTQLSSTISDFDTEVRSSRLDQMSNPTAAVAMNSQKLTGVADPTNPQDAATMNWVSSQLSGITTGLVLKGAVRAISAANINIASPGTTIDGLTPSNGQVFLLTAQTTGSQNGPYVYNGSGVSMTRATNWNTSGQAVLGSFWVVEEGSQADKYALMTNNGSFTLNTDTAVFTYVGAVSGTGVQGVEQDLGDGSSTVFTVTHNFGTRACHVTVFRNASPYDEPDVYVTHATANTITIEPDEVWTSAQFHCVVTKGV